MSDSHDNVASSVILAQEPHAVVESDALPWQRQLDEPAQWYTRFLVYLHEGPDRTIARAIQTYAADVDHDLDRTYTHWYFVASKRHWADRAAAYDVEQWWDIWQSEEQLRTVSRKHRIVALSQTLEQTRKGIEALSIEELKKTGIGPLSAAQKTATKILRDELEGTDRHDRLDIAVLIGQLPDDVQDMLRSNAKK